MRLFIWGLIILPIGLAAIIVALRLLFPLPPLGDRPVSAWLSPSAETRLGSLVLSSMDQHPGLTGITPLVDGRDAFAARILLARAAELSIDAQYYIWQADATGWMLLDELRTAAARGIRVRLLVDDNGIPGMDEALSGLDALETAEVRIFNPFTLRSPKAASYLFDFPRLNRRMHNKSFTVDGAVTVLGGRNVGDIYFTYGEGTAYADLDVMATGKAAADVSEDFDRYWNSGSAYPANLILPPAPGGLERIEGEAKVARASAQTTIYTRALMSSRLVGSILGRTLPLEWTTVELLSDLPTKGLGLFTDNDILLARLLPIIINASMHVDIVSAYFVPGEGGTSLLSDLARRGVAVRVLTNGYESTDVSLVHAFYAHWRPYLAKASVVLLELRRATGLADRPELVGPPGSSGASLHAKTVALDRNKIFVGSFNFDPRSAKLNCEMGLLIGSSTLAQAISSHIDAETETRAYRVREAADGSLEWVKHDDGVEMVLKVEPGSSFWSRMVQAVLGRLPIEWML